MAITGEGLDVKGIGQVLSDAFFQVPTNQRSYMWEAEHVTDYWNDILNAMQPESGTGFDDYFIGTIVLSRTEGDALEVVDGQQRLATTTIILAAIRDYYHEKDNASGRAAIIERKYLIEQNEESLEYEPHLSLNEHDNRFFQENVVNRPKGEEREYPQEEKGQKKRMKDSERNIATACTIIRGKLHEHINGVRASDVSSRLQRIVRYIREHVKVICVTVPNHENAYTIFETLNDRGLDLTKADLLKNHLFRTAGKKEQEAQTKWAHMIGGLETVTRKDVTVDFIRYLWISTNGHVRGKELYSRIKATVKTAGQAIELATDLADSANVYAAILNSDHPRWDAFGEETKIDMSNLIMLGIERIHPITLAVARTFKKPEEFKKAIYYLVAASVRLLIAGPAPGGQFEKSVADVAPKVSKGEIVTAKALAEEMNKEIVPADAAFLAKFAVASVSQTHLARYYLRALNNGYDLKETHPARAEMQKTNVEHILPQSRSSAWGHIKEDTAKAYCKRIGNLTILKPKENTDAGNGGFLDVKVPIYKASSFPLTAEIAKEAIWNDTSIDDRQKRLAALAVKIWTIKVK